MGGWNAGDVTNENRRQSTLPSRPAAGRFEHNGFEHNGRPRGAPISPGLCMAVVLILVIVAGCGRRTSPRPLENFLPGVSQLKARQQGERVLISWRGPSAQQSDPFSGLRGYVLHVDEFAFACGPATVRCASAATHEMDLPVGAPALVREAGRTYYYYTPSSNRDAWRFRVSARLGDGVSLEASTGLMRGLNAIPVHTVRWEWAAPPIVVEDEAPAPIPAVRLFWEPRRESIVRVMSGGGPPVERERFYRANVYRRRPGQAWPMEPVNKNPVTKPFWIDRVSQAGDEELPGAPTSILQYTLRLVDRFGGEGPPAEPIHVTIPRELSP